MAGASAPRHAFRWYEPQTGRYESPDPVRETNHGRLLGPRGQQFLPASAYGGIPDALEDNAYEFALNNPQTHFDPLGLAAQTWGCDCFPDPLAGGEAPPGCCECHDACYDRFEYTAMSWIPTLLGIPGSPCVICNLWVIDCIASYLGSGAGVEPSERRCPWPVSAGMYGGE